MRGGMIKGVGCAGREFSHSGAVCPAIHHWIDAIALLVYCDMVDALLTTKQHAWGEWSQSTMKSSPPRFHTHPFHLPWWESSNNSKATLFLSCCD
nr:hypothetical protein Iba_chr01bCG16220 [Ipomoea batatas]